MALRTLASLDKGGVERAKLADAFRRRADELWDRGDQRGAQPLYQLTPELDPLDLEARRRAAWEPPRRRRPRSPRPPPAPAWPRRRRWPPRSPARPPRASAAPDRRVARGPAQSARLQGGRRRGPRARWPGCRLQEAEAAFNRALEADPEQRRRHRRSGRGGLRALALHRGPGLRPPGRPAGPARPDT